MLNYVTIIYNMSTRTDAYCCGLMQIPTLTKIEMKLSSE